MCTHLSQRKDGRTEMGAKLQRGKVWFTLLPETMWKFMFHVATADNRGQGNCGIGDCRHTADNKRHRRLL